MGKLVKPNQALINLYGVLSDSLALFYLILTAIGIGFILLIANTNLVYNSNSFNYYVVTFLMAGIMYYAHKKMVRDPLHSAIDAYLLAIKNSKLNGDELLNQKLLPTYYMYKAFSKYNLGLQKTGIQKLYQGLAYLNFEINEENVSKEYKETLRLISLAKPKT